MEPHTGLGCGPGGSGSARAGIVAMLFNLRSSCIVRAENGTNKTPLRFIAQPTIRRKTMDWNRVEGNWKQVKGKVKEKWGKLTDDDLDAINGRRDQLEGKIQERYGIAKDQVRKDIDTWYTDQRW
jgi:uncharacterized protein YjbJ (UPF0337 family)